MESVQYHLKCKQNEVNQAVLLPGDIERADYIGTKFFRDSEKIAENREFHIYNGSYEDKPIAVCSTGIGCMSAAVAIEELINIGCKYFIRVGTCGTLSSQINPGDIIIATGAVRGDGASKEYIPIEYPAVADYRTVNALQNRAKKEDSDYNLGIIRTHDAFYMESPFAFGDYKKRVTIWAEAGTLAIENESSTLFVIGSLKNVQVGAILVAAGNLITGGKSTKDELQKSINKAITIASGALVDLQKGEEKKI
ncbi:MAG: nucleoside phosphorylase [Candidatus Atribacteria bacterium]|nr:nucleoside phosphorylase [Candidatus Atribacteria bacterium]